MAGYRQTEWETRDYETIDTNQDEDIVPSQQLPPLSRYSVSLGVKATFQTALYSVVNTSKQP